MATASWKAFWCSPFRAFFLLGAGYAVVLGVTWAGAYGGLWIIPGQGTPSALWHGHEMLFGFAAAIVVGFVLTALPSWAGLEEIRGPRLQLLAVLWLAGRVAVWATPWLGAAGAAIVDLLLFPAVIMLVTPQLLRAANRLYLLLLPVLVALILANLAYHLALHDARPEAAGNALRAALYAIIVLFALTGGLLTPIFTDTALRERGKGPGPSPHAAAETLSVGLLVLLGVIDLVTDTPSTPVGLVAVACAVVCGARLVAWQGWRVLDAPLVWLMHLGFVWLVAALLFKAAAELGAPVPESTWVHAFTLGSLGMMMLGLMTRVALRHTGRRLETPGVILLACAFVAVATILRLVSSLLDWNAWLIVLASLLWAGGFALYLERFATTLLAPSLPQVASDATE